MKNTNQHWILSGLDKIRINQIRSGVDHLDQTDIELLFPELLSDVCCGYGWPTGWDHIVYIILDKIQCHNEWGYLHKSVGSPIVIDQIKEKFGMLRFYTSGGYETARPSLQQIYDAIDLAEELTSAICCETGSCKNLRRTLGWTSIVSRELTNRRSVPAMRIRR